MKVITKQLTKDLLVASAFVLFALSVLIGFFDLVKQMRYVGDTFGFGSALWLTTLALPSRLYEITPIAVLLASVYVMTRWAYTSEFTILRVSGLSALRFWLMTLVSAVVMIAMTYFLGEVVMPYADQTRQSVSAQLFNQQLSAKGYASGIWVKDTVSADPRDPDAIAMRIFNVRSIEAGSQNRTGAWRVFEFDQSGQLRRVSRATYATYVYGQGWHLHNATVQTLPKLGTADQLKTARSMYEMHQSVVIDSNVQPEMLGVLTIKPERMGLFDLKAYIEHLRMTGQDRDRYEVAFWTKLFYPLSIIAMLSLSMSFAYSNVRAGGIAVRVFMGLMIGIVFYSVNNIISFLGQLNNWPAVTVAVTPSLTMFVLSWIFLWWVERR